MTGKETTGGFFVFSRISYKFSKELKEIKVFLKTCFCSVEIFSQEAFLFERVVKSASLQKFLAIKDGLLRSLTKGVLPGQLGLEVVCYCIPSLRLIELISHLQTPYSMFCLFCGLIELCRVHESNSKVPKLWSIRAQESEGHLFSYQSVRQV